MGLWICGFAGGSGGVPGLLLDAGTGLGLTGGTGGGVGFSALY